MPIIQTPSFRLAANLQGHPRSPHLALILPGRLDTKDYACFNQHLEFFASRGFYAIAIDPPGTWDSPGGLELFTTTNYLQAVNELIEFFGNRPTLLLGHSRGGAIATLAGTNHPSVTGLVLINPSLGPPSPPSPESQITGVYIDFRDHPPGIVSSPVKKKFVMSLNYFTDGSRYNDAAALQSCTKPKIIFYSDRDEFNSPAEVEAIFRTLPAPKQLHLIHATHDYRHFPSVVTEINQVIGSFLATYLHNKP